MEITQEYIKSILTYNPNTGKFIWRRKKWGHKGKEAGYINPNGYRVIMIDNKNYGASRLAWLFHYGEFSKKQIDHINHNRSDNRIENLREVTNQQNQMNRTFTGNTTGFIGVYWDKNRKKYAPKIKVNQKVINLGRYDSIEEAIAMRLCAESVYGFHINHGS